MALIPAVAARFPDDGCTLAGASIEIPRRVLPGNVPAGKGKRGPRTAPARF
jgi:hypothetical protein